MLGTHLHLPRPSARDGRPRPTRQRATAALLALTVLAAPLVAQPQASADLGGTATVADTNRPRANTFSATLDGDFTSTTRVLMRTLDAGTTTWREWGMQVGQWPLALSLLDDYDTVDAAGRELLVEGTGGMVNGLTGYDYLRATGNGAETRNVSGTDVPTSFDGDGAFQRFSTTENGGLLVEVSFLEFTKVGGLLQRTPIADAEFRLEILSYVSTDDVDYRLPTLNELADSSIEEQTAIDAATQDKLNSRRTDVALFLCDPTASASCAAEPATAGGAFDPVVDDAAVAAATGIDGDTQVGVAQAFGQANADGKVWLWLTGQTLRSYMIRLYDRRTDDPATDGFNPLTQAALDEETGEVLAADPIGDDRVLRVISEQSGYAFEGSNPAPSQVSSSSRRTTNFFTRRHDGGSTVLNFRGFLPEAPIDVYERIGGGTTTSTSQCVRNASDICVRPVPPVVPVVFNGAQADYETYDVPDDASASAVAYAADVNDAYFPYDDHGATGIYSFVPNCDGLALGSSTLTVDDELVAFDDDDSDDVAPQTTARVQLRNSCGGVYRGAARTFIIKVPDPANPGGPPLEVEVTTNSSGAATVVIEAPYDTSTALTDYADNIGTDFGVEGGIDGSGDTTVTVNFYGAGVPSPTDSTLTMLDDTAGVDETGEGIDPVEFTTARVQLNDALGDPVGEGVEVCLSFAFEPAEGVSEDAFVAPVPPGDPTPDVWTTDADGRVDVDIPSPTVGTVTVTSALPPCGEAGTIGDASGATVGAEDGVTGTYTAGDPDAGSAAVEIEDERIDPDGTSETTVTVTVRDANGNPVGAGQDVCLEMVDNGDGSPSTGTLSSGPWTTDENGQVTATVTSPTEDGSATITAWLGTCGKKDGEIGSVEVAYAAPPAPPAPENTGTLVCTPDPVAPGATVDCAFSDGNPSIDYLWRASYLANAFAEAGMTTLPDGTGAFSFTVPPGAACEDILVELVDWNISTVITVLCDLVPAGIPAGEGPGSDPAGFLWLLAAVLGPLMVRTVRIGQRAGVR